MAMASVINDAYHAASCAVEILRPAFDGQGVMAETEVVGRFKEFARVRLLAALREVGSAGLLKQPTYAEIRDSFTAEHGWPKELDEIEPRPARTPRWLNRLHWVVAELVQAGVLEPSEGRDTLHPTPFGLDLIRVPVPFRDTPQTRALIEAVQSTEPDEQRTSEAERALADFRRRFPPEKLGTLTLDEYAIGGGDRDNFCWWLERGLQNLGRYTPGSSWGHFLYKGKSGSIERIQKLKELSAEGAMQRVADWHAAVVRIGGGEAPELLDTSPPDFPESRSRILKVLNSYFPDRFLPINSVVHLGRFLSEFGVQESEIPHGPVARNHLLLKLYEAVGQPHGLSPWDFGRLLYTHFDPKPARLDATRLRGAMRLFKWVYGGGCKAERFVDGERNYKEEIAQRWQAVSGLEELARTMTEGREVEKARELSRALVDPPSNLINYRYQSPLRDLSDPADARLLVEAVAELLRSGEADDAVPDVGRFNARMAPLYERLGPEQRNAASRSIPTLILMLTFRERDVYVRSDLFHRARQALGKKPALDDEGMLSTPGYRELRGFAEAVRDGIEGLEPADMIDVESFLSAVFSPSELWFGGVTYTDNSGAHDMLDRFRERGIRGASCGGTRPAITRCRAHAPTQP
jgi:hypothetical protein